MEGVFLSKKSYFLSLVSSTLHQISGNGMYVFDYLVKTLIIRGFPLWQSSSLLLALRMVQTCFLELDQKLWH